MDADNLHKSQAAPATGELILQNGRQAGARRPLCAPATFIGREANCDIRLNVDGVDPLHCLVIMSPDGVKLRDLHSVDGSYVNGVRVDSSPLKQGDLIQVGPFQFRLELAQAPLPVPLPPEPTVDEERASLRIQASAVAAQQIALEEEEARLQQRRHDLQQQEEQLAAHFAEKQRQVQLWSEHTRVEREILRREKLEHQKHISEREEELRVGRQNLAHEQQHVAQERERINKIYQRLRERWQKHWGAEKEKYLKLAKKLQAEGESLEADQRDHAARQADLARQIREFNTERDVGRRELREERASLGNAQLRWRRWRRKESLVLRSKLRDVELAHIKLHAARELLVKDKATWEKQQSLLRDELHGVNNRIVNQRLRIHQLQNEIAALDVALQERKAQIAQPASPTEGETAEPGTPAVAEAPAVMETPDPAWQKQKDVLERLTGDLADQRAQLIEQYAQIVDLQEQWQTERDQAALELDTLAQRLLAQDASIQERDQQTGATEARLNERQQALDALRQEIEVWHAQLKGREQLRIEEHERLLSAIRESQTLLDKQLQSLTKLRQRWNRRRQQEIERFQTNHALLEQKQEEVDQHRTEAFERLQKVEEQKRILAEKALALEEYRRETLQRIDDPTAERQIERLRRRWLSINANLIRDARDERVSAQRVLTAIEEERAELLQKLDKLVQSDANLSDKQALLDEREVLLTAKQQRLEMEQKVLPMNDIIELPPDAIYEEPPMDKAA